LLSRISDKLFHGENMPKKDKNIIEYTEQVLKIGRFYAGAFIAAIVIILALGIFFLSNIDIAYKNKMVPAQYEPVKPTKEITLQKGILSPGVNLEKTGFPNAELVASGKELFKTNCAACHGETGNGDGPGAAALNPKPRNFHQKDGWKNGRNLSQIFKTLAEGIPSSPMVAYDFLSISDRISIIHFVRTFAEDFPKVTKEELTQLDAAYNISKGKTTPNTIPVDLAVSKIIDETKPVIDGMQKKITSIETMKEPGADLFNKFTRSKMRALTVLYNNHKWKDSKENLFMMISYSIPENGFKQEILRLKPEEQQQFFSFLKSNLFERM